MTAIKVPPLIEDKVKYIPHDGVHCDRMFIGGVMLNHVELGRLWKLLDQIIWGGKHVR